MKVIWSREEDIAQDKQRPPNVSRLSAVLGARGLPTAWFTRSLWFTQDGIERVGPATADYAISNMPYKVPNRRHERINAKAHVPVATHRAPGTNQHGFMTECFVDEVALAGGWDPLEWRLEMTQGMPDWQLVLRTLKEKSGFRTDLPRGEGMGVAIVEDHGSIAAACAKVRVSSRGELAVEKVVIVVDSGHVINPLNAAEQCEGGVCWELSHAWLGGLELREGRFVNTNFDSYPLLRMSQMPEVEVHFALSGGKKWGGIGEPAGPPVPPAVANAIYFATRKENSLHAVQEPRSELELTLRRRRSDRRRPTCRAARTSKVYPMAAATRRMVRNSGFPFPASALYRLSRPRPARRATRDMPRARAIVPSAFTISPGSPSASTVFRYANRVSSSSR